MRDSYHVDVTDDYLSPSEGDENFDAREVKTLGELDDYLSPSEGDENDITIRTNSFNVMMITYLRVKETKTYKK